MRLRSFLLMTIWFLGCIPLWGQQNLNLATLKQDTQVFERIIDERLRQVFTSPYALSSEPHAAYLQGYGVVISFQLNINRAKIRTPFGDVDAPQIYGGPGKNPASAYVADKRDEQIKRVKEILIECLADYARAIKQLSAHDRISISAHIEDRNELDPERRRIVMVVSASRDDVDLLALNKITPEDFREKLLVTEY